MTDFDYPTWAAQGRANRDKLPNGVAEALGPERDWIDEFIEAYIAPHDATHVAEFLRSKCRPIGNDTVTDEMRALIQDALTTSVRCTLNQGWINKARAVLREATQ